MAGLGGSGRSRRTHRTPETLEVITRALRGGNTRADAAVYAGMDASTLRRWMHADARVQRAIVEAEAQARVRMATIVSDAAFGRPAQYDDAGNQIRAEQKPDPDRAQWWLERRDPANWGRRVTIDIRSMVERHARDAGLDVDEVLAEIDAMYQEHAEQFRQS